MNGRAAHRTATLVLSLAMIAIGVALVAQAVTGAGSAAAIRGLLGVLFTAGGAGRTYLEVRRRRRA